MPLEMSPEAADVAFPPDITPVAEVAFPSDMSPKAEVDLPSDMSPAKAEQPSTSVRSIVALSLRTFFMDLSPSKGSESETQLLRLDTGSVFTEQSRYKKADGGGIAFSHLP